jgi:hypothetical protein
MDPEPFNLDDDDESVPMTLEERQVWVYLVTVVVTAAGYVLLIALRLRSQPADEVSWVAPLLVTFGLSVGGTILGTMVAAVVGGACRDDGVGAPAADVRDREIEWLGNRASAGVIGAGFGAGLILAMVDADTFWIGNVLFLFGVLGAVVETITKIRLYRRGF